MIRFGGLEGMWEPIGRPDKDQMLKLYWTIVQCQAFLITSPALAGEVITSFYFFPFLGNPGLLRISSIWAVWRLLCAAIKRMV
jgi:hypothetical protein